MLKSIIRLINNNKNKLNNEIILTFKLIHKLLQKNKTSGTHFPNLSQSSQTHYFFFFLFCFFSPFCFFICSSHLHQWTFFFFPSSFFFFHSFFFTAPPIKHTNTNLQPCSSMHEYTNFWVFFFQNNTNFQIILLISIFFKTIQEINISSIINSILEC